MTRIETLEILLGDVLVGYLTHFKDGKNIFIFAQDYVDMGANRPTLSLSFTEQKLLAVYSSMLKLPPFFSNLLPEGALRELICQELKIHINDEFSLLKALGDDLPGAVIARVATEIPAHVLNNNDKKTVFTKIEQYSSRLHFSLAGIQLKFSMQAMDKGFTLPKSGVLGDYIIKTPSNMHPDVPQNEFAMMQLAKAVGIVVPETQLVELKKISGLPEINMPKEKYAYAIKRFDRISKHKRIHCEDFAQILGVRSDRKYDATNYDSIAKLIYELFPNALTQTEELIKRLIFNLLIGNTDAHLQNFSVIYPDQKEPQLSPTYDLVSTLSYIDNRELALNLAKQKNFYTINEDVLRYFAKRTGISENLVLETTYSVVKIANKKWPQLIKQLPLNKKILHALQQHWQKLQSPFKINITIP